jgi:hypothetical protein
MSSVKEIEQRQARLTARTLSILDEKDANKIMALAEELRVEAAELDQVCQAFAARMEKETKTSKSRFEVVLTHDQRQRIRVKTGVLMDSVFIDDSTGALNAAMVSTQPAMIEAIALRVAERQKLEGPAKQAARRNVEESVALLERQGEQMAEKVRELKEDPRFREMMDFDKKK